MLLLGGVLYGLALKVDQAASDEAMLRTWWLHSGSGDDARNLLSTLVAAIITMSSVVFSITIVALSLAANQFGSRLVRTYMSDPRSKTALGLFTMTIVYCLLALRSVNKDMPSAEVPHVTVTVGLVLGLVCVLVLLLFLHFVAHSIVADDVIRRVASELERSIAQLSPLDWRQAAEPPNDALPGDFEARCVIVPSRDEGYVQAIEYERLAALAAEHDLVLRLDFRAGAFMCKAGWLAAVYPSEAVTTEIAQTIQSKVVIGALRTPTQDLEFSIRHLVDIALRALSPGINDANTAVVVVDRLRGALSRLLGKALPSAVYQDDAGRARVVGRPNRHSAILDAAFNQIRQAAADQPAVIIALLDGIGRLAEHVRLSEQRDALLHHANLIAAAGLRGLDERSDRADIEQALAGAERKLQRLLREPINIQGRPAITASAQPHSR